MKAITQQTLDKMQCSEPDCEHQHESIFLHSRCHPNSPTFVSYYSGILSISCAECEDLVVNIKVDAGEE